MLNEGKIERQECQRHSYLDRDKYKGIFVSFLLTNPLSHMIE